MHLQNELAKQILAKIEKLPDVALQGGIAYVGSRVTGHWTGGLLGLIGLKLAQAPNLASGLAGVGILGGLGLSLMVDKDGNVTPPPIPEIGQPISGVGAAGGGGGYIPPPVGAIVTITTMECQQRGGTILQVYPNTRLCSCQLPTTPPVVPPGSGGGYLPPRRAIQ